MARERNIGITLRLKDEFTKNLEKISNNILLSFAKRVAGSLGSIASVAGVEEFVRRSVNAALDAEKATAGLAAALRAQGDGAIDSLPGLKAHAEALSRMSLADDEAVQGAQRILVSLGKLRGEGLDRALKSALDLAAGLGIDLTEAATMIAKAAQGSVKPFTLLGFEFKKNATDAEKLDAVLAGVQQRFGGMAASEIATASGQLHELSEAFGELLETLGTKLVGGTAGISALTKAFQDLNDEANKPGAMGFWKSIGLILAGGAQGSAGLSTALALVGADAALATMKAQELADSLDPQKFSDPFGAWAVIQAANLARLAAAEDAAAKAADARAKAIERINDRTDVEVVQPVDFKSDFHPETDLQGSLDIQWGQALSALGEMQTQIVAQNDSWAQMVEIITQANGGLIEMGGEIRVGGKVFDYFSEGKGFALSAAANTLTQLGDALIDAAFATRSVFETSTEELVKQLAKSLVLSGIKLALGPYGIILDFGLQFAGAYGATQHHAAGGVVYAAGGTVALGAMDSPVPLNPGGRAARRGGLQDGRPREMTINLGPATSLTRFLVDNSQSVVKALDYHDARSA